MARFTKYKWRLYADKNIPEEMVNHLRRTGMDVLWVIEESDLRHREEDRFHYRKAKELRRYLLTNDADFWNDRKYPLKDSPGLVLLTGTDITVAKYLPVLLRKLINDYNPLADPLYLEGVKIRVGAEAFVIKMVDRDTQKVSVESWAWRDLV